MRLAQRAVELRSTSTDAEQRLWHCLRDRRFMNLKFKRQVPLAVYIADFACLAPRLVIELDGHQHLDNAAYDRQRDDCLRSMGFVVLRFWNRDVLNDTGAVLAAIRQTVLALDACALARNEVPDNQGVGLPSPALRERGWRRHGTREPLKLLVNAFEPACSNGGGPPRLRTIAGLAVALCPHPIAYP